MAIIESRKQRDGTVKYRARVRLTGFPHQTKTFDRKTDARDWARQVETDLKNGVNHPSRDDKRRTVAELIDHYITRTLPTKERNKDADKVKAQLAWWRERIGKYSLFAIDAKAIAESLRALQDTPTRFKRPRSPSTVNRYRAALSACFTEAVVELGWLRASPMASKRAGRRKEPKGRIRWLSDEERARLLAACRASWAPWLHPLVLLALATGGRRGELLGLKWRDVDLDRGMVVFHITKNGERRAVPIAGVAVDALRAWSGGSPDAAALVFPGGPDPEIPVYIEQAWREAMAEANIQNFRFHDLRHSAASYLAMSGATAPEIAAVLGHKTLQMVQRYAHLGEQHTASVITRMTDKFLKE